MSTGVLERGSGLSLTIGDVTVPVPTEVPHPERVPWVLPGEPNSGCIFGNSESSTNEMPLSAGDVFFQVEDEVTCAYLRWICQKELLRQDMCLTGEPGPALRWLVLMYCHLTRREVQCVSLSRDSTESDLGQRREVRNGTLFYDDQSVVTAAREGQLLLLEGLGRVERNVLPVINNLLETREMHLENGMALIHPERYDKIFNEMLSESMNNNGRSGGGDFCVDEQMLRAIHAELQSMGFIRVSENFRVIGIMAPVPPYDGSPLDPPLRSRFQCLYVDVPVPTPTALKKADMVPGGRSGKDFEALLRLRSSIDEVNAQTRKLGHGDRQGSNSSCALSLHGLQNIGSYELALVLQQLVLFPDIPLRELLWRSFPWTLYAQQTTVSGATSILGTTKLNQEYSRLLATCNVTTPSSQHHCYQGNGGEQAGDKLKSSSMQEDYVAVTPECYNDIILIDNICAVESKRVVMLKYPVLVGDAVIDGVKSNYRLPLYLGEEAAILAYTGSPLAHRVCGAIDVKEHCTRSSTVFTPELFRVLQSMLQLHIAGRHILLLGSSGSGKTCLLREFAVLLRYRVETIYLYADMTVKDLFQRRTTDPSSGDTTWKNSALIDAALNGRIAVLDGVDKMPQGILSSLQHLLIDGSATLCDGSVLKSYREYEIIKEKLCASEEDMRARRIFPIHPAFRVVGTARLPVRQGTKVGDGASQTVWRITHDASELFGIVQMPESAHSSFRAILLRAAESELLCCECEGVGGVLTPEHPKGLALSNLEHDIDLLLRLRDNLERLEATEPNIPQLNLRQLLSITRLRVRYPEDLNLSVESTLLLPLLSSLTAEKVRQVMRNCGLKSTDARFVCHRRSPRSSSASEESDEGTLSGCYLRELPHTLSPSTTKPAAGFLEEVIVPRVFGFNGKPILRINRAYTAKEKAMVPHVQHFHSNDTHESVIVWLAKQYAAGNNILLIGNQGVGKNKVVDAFLARVEIPREYIQLHRDTTVGSLTINPTVENGRIIWGDSPLVRAVQQGYCLVIDEIDKAPVEVVEVLKGLIEDHEMQLRDGRQIRGLRSCTAASGITVDKYGCDDQQNVINMHPQFRIIVLANPPGFPFHGNDFYRECGDLFGPLVMPNAEARSQLHVLRAYGQNIPGELLMSLVKVFQHLQADYQEGNIAYPFSLRELIAVVKHMSAFPEDGVYGALSNVFNFDVHNEDTLHLVRGVLQLHLGPLIQPGGVQKLLPLRTGRPVPLRASSLLRVAAGPSVLSALTPGCVTTTLSTRQLTDSECGGGIIWKFIPAWWESYGATDFIGMEPACRRPVEFTEWCATIALPFLHRDDSVVRVAVCGSDDVTGQPRSIAVLFIRRYGLQEAGSGDNNNKSMVETLLAVTSPPSVGSVTIDGIGCTCIPAGRVQIFNLTGLLSSHSFQSSLRLFSGGVDALFTSGIVRKAPRDVFGTSSLFVEVVNGHLGLILLCAVTAPGLSPASVSLSQQQMRPQHDLRRGTDSACVLVVQLAPACGSLPLCQCVAYQGCGLVSMTRPRRPELHVWIKGYRVMVTFPTEEVIQVQFLSQNYASVRLRRLGLVLCGVLKLHLEPSGFATASFCVLPKGVNGTVIGLAGIQEPIAKGTLMKPITPEELRGAVIVVNPGSDTDNGDVMYMMVDSYSSQLQSWSVRTFADPDVACAIRCGVAESNVLKVDRVHRKLVFSSEDDPVVGSGAFTVVDYGHHTMCRFAPLPAAQVCPLPMERAPSSFSLDEVAGNILWHGDGSRLLVVGDLIPERIERRHRRLSALLKGSVNQIGGAVAVSQERLPLSYSKPCYGPSNNLKHGREDDGEHHGGNTFAGGTGGTDTAGLGGLVGPYRLDKGWPVHQVSGEAKRQVPQYIVEEAKRVGRAALQERLKAIGMTAKEHEQYGTLHDRVRTPVATLRSMLSRLRAVEGERRWLRGQTDGVWDDTKIVEGIVGERNIFKRRGGSVKGTLVQSKLKKRLLFVLDVSASMYRFEGTDQRLTKLLESTVMVMEAFSGFEEKIDYAMFGHNGDSACIEFVPFGKPPVNQKERVEICQRMIAHAQYCWSGDNTVQAMRNSIGLVMEQKGEAYLVFVVSDANLSRYGIEPRELSDIIRSNSEVQMFCIFIATLGEQALNLRDKLPSGRGFECMDTQALPHILKQIFMSVNIL